MPTPRSIEINKPGLFTVQHPTFKTLRCEFFNRRRDEAKQPLAQGVCISLEATVDTAITISGHYITD
jgi:hypothetical protein